jgi:hypothetical protein
MQKNQEDLSPDLEWMLQSGQVSEDVLVEHLSREFYGRIYSYCLDQLIYPEEARRAVRDTFIAALNARNYPADKTIGDWLAGIAAEACRVRQIELENYRFLNPRLIVSILRRSPTRSLSPQQLDRGIKELKAWVQDKGSHRLTKNGALEIGLVIATVAFLLGALQFSGAIFATNEGPGVAIPEVYPAPIGAEEAAIVESAASASGMVFKQFIDAQGKPIPVQPLSQASSHEDIWRRLLLSRSLWKTLWADVWLVLRGPEGYRGPPMMERHQIWIEQEDRVIHLGGPARGEPNSAEIIVGRSYYAVPVSFPNSIDDYARLGSQLPWFLLNSELVFNSPYLSNFYFTGIDSLPPINLRYEAVGEDHWIGRRAVVVQATDLDGHLVARYWLDNHMGIALRAQYFDPRAEHEAALEISLAQLNLDVEFPEEITNLDEKSLLDLGFTLDYNARPEPSGTHPIIPPTWMLTRTSRLLPMPPPDGLNLADSRLAFQALDDLTGMLPLQSGVYANGKIYVQVFGDQYYLGDISFTDPFRVICARSPDGTRFAFSEWPGSPGESTYPITWFDLNEQKSVERIIPGTLVIRLAFSPDSRRLAVAGINQEDGGGRLYVIDTRNGAIGQLDEVDQTYSLAWSPDGRQLAALKWSGMSTEVGHPILVRVYDLSTGRAVHRRVQDYEWGESTLEVPMEDWTARFDLPVFGLESCVAPPDR